jgi:lysophospholipase L1-like esterase
VIDNLGINGARAVTPLGWDEQSFVDQVRERQPELAILAYGTNDVVSELQPERYPEHYRKLLGRIRKGRADVPCLLAGPTDLVQDGATHPRVKVIDDVERATAKELGCAYFSVLAAMGGEGSFLDWMRRTPPLAAPDGIHLTVDGYRELGARFSATLLDGYAQFKAD